MPYVHGYADEELDRLTGSANTLAHLLHQGMAYPEGALVLEAGCGVGAQTRHVLSNSPGIRLVSVDIARTSLLRAQKDTGKDNASFLQADLHNLPFQPKTFDHIFICFVLEHLPDPVEVLRYLKTLLKPKGTITAIEGDHGSAFFYPETEAAVSAWQCLQQLQLQTSGDGHIGRRLYALFKDSGATTIDVTPVPVYCDPSLPEMMGGFADKTIVGMLKGIEEEVLSRKMLSPQIWHQGINDLLTLSKSDRGSFSYTFFRTIAMY